jgi:vancomycin resistance protein YoaR
MDEAALRHAVQGIASQHREARVTVVRSAVSGIGPASFATTPRDMGYQVDVEATVRAVLHRGRQLNPFSALADHLRATFGALEVPVVNRVDGTAFDRWIAAATAALRAPAQEGSLRFEGTTVSPVAPRPGAGVQTLDLRELVPDALATLTADTITVPGSLVPARTTAADVAALLSQAREALSAPIKLRRGHAAIVLSPKEIGRVLRVRATTSDAVTSLELAADPDELERVAADDIADVEERPESATFRPDGNKIHLVPSKEGFAFDKDVAAAQVVQVATSADRTARLKGSPVDAGLTTKEAKALHITGLVSTFTTYHSCCQPRVHNIHRIADLVRGTIVLPGEAYSLNQAVGVRTPEKGFVKAPGITNGELVDQYGGGISQFTTTMYNAIFFGGYRFEAYRAHSYYFSRYPMGREATLSWPTPDLAFRDDTDSGVFIWTSYTDTSITVSFYGRTDVEVESVTGQPTHTTKPPTQCEENPALAKGEQVTTQEGIDGFDVVVQRILHYPDGTSKTETYFTHYKPEPIIVQQRSCGDEESPGPTPTPSP